MDMASVIVWSRYQKLAVGIIGATDGAGLGMWEKLRWGLRLGNCLKAD